MVFAGLEYPDIKFIVEWPAFLFKDIELLAFNKIALISLIAFLVPTILFTLAKRQTGPVPKGARNFSEAIIDFVDTGIIKPTIGHGGEAYRPFLLTLFLFIAIGNLHEVIPFFQMPANARMGGPMVLALVVWVTWIGVAIKQQGISFFTHVVWPPNVPGALKPFVGLLEFLSTFLIRPFSHAVRLFANMLAGHILLVTISVMCIALWQAGPLASVEVVTFPFLVIMTGFEIFVSILQAYVFTILTAVYIAGSRAAHH